MTASDRSERCEVCGEPFTADQWEDRHTTEDGPVHAACCVECPSPDIESVEVFTHNGGWCGAIIMFAAPTLMFDGYSDLAGLLRSMAERIES